jgi:hypothetical protein
MGDIVGIFLEQNIKGITSHVLVNAQVSPLRLWTLSKYNNNKHITGIILPSIIFVNPFSTYYSGNLRVIFILLNINICM